jgi:hypothetical protein
MKLWNETKQNGLFTINKIMELIKIFEPDHTSKDENWLISLPVLFLFLLKKNFLKGIKN